MCQRGVHSYVCDLTHPFPGFLFSSPRMHCVHCVAYLYSHNALRAWAMRLHVNKDKKDEEIDALTAGSFRRSK
jgi:hypothetical protein